MTLFILLFTGTTHGNQRKTSWIRVYWWRFSTGEKDVNFGRGRASSTSAMAIYGHGRRGRGLTLLPIQPRPLPTGLSPGNLLVGSHGKS